MKFFSNGCLKPELPEENILKEKDHVWTPVLTLLPQPPARSKHATCIHDRKLYVYGGRGKYGTISDFWLFDLEAELWGEIHASGNHPGMLEGHSMLVTGDFIYVFGGKACSSEEETQLWSYDIINNAWSKLLSDKNVLWPKSRRHHTAVLYKNAMYIYGGFHEVYGPTNELWLYDFNSKSWHLDSYGSENAQASPSPRYQHAAIVHGNKMWICGGLTGLTSNAEVWNWHFDKRQWCQIKSSNGPYELSNHAAAKVGWNMYVYGKVIKNNQSSEEMWRFSLWKETWKRCSFNNALKPDQITGHTMVSFTEFNKHGSNKTRTQSMPTLKSVKVKTASSSSSVKLPKKTNSIFPESSNCEKLFYPRPSTSPAAYGDKCNLFNASQHSLGMSIENQSYDNKIEIIDLEVSNNCTKEDKSTYENRQWTETEFAQSENMAQLKLEKFIKSFEEPILPKPNKNIPLKSILDSTVVYGGQGDRANSNIFSYNLSSNVVPNENSKKLNLSEEETSFIISSNQINNHKLITFDNVKNSEDVIEVKPQLCKSDTPSCYGTDSSRPSTSFEDHKLEKPIRLQIEKQATLPNKFEMDFDICLLVIGGKGPDSVSSLSVKRPVRLWKCQNCKCDD